MSNGKGSKRRPESRPGLYADNWEGIRGFGRKTAEAAPVNKEPLRGLKADVVIIDEFAFQDDEGEDALLAYLDSLDDIRPRL